MSGTGKLLLICHWLASMTSDADRSSNIIPSTLTHSLHYILVSKSYTTDFMLGFSKRQSGESFLSQESLDDVMPVNCTQYIHVYVPTWLSVCSVCHILRLAMCEHQTATFRFVWIW